MKQVFFFGVWLIMCGMCCLPIRAEGPEMDATTSPTVAAPPAHSDSILKYDPDAQDIEMPELWTDEAEANSEPHVEVPQSPEAYAEYLIRRDDTAGAVTAYLDLMKTALQQGRDAARSAQKDQAAYAYAQAEVFLEHAAELASVCGMNSILMREVDSLLETYADAAPSVVSRMQWVAAFAHLRAGDSGRRGEDAHALGLIRSWQIIGPFENERGSMFQLTHPIETTMLDLAQSFPGKKDAVMWRLFENPHVLAYLDFDALFRPNDACFAYAATVIEAPADMPAALHIGSSEMAAVWLNGRKVYTFEGRREPDFDQNMTGCLLKKGRNLLVLKVGDDAGSWGAYVRLTTPEGRPLSGVTIAAQPERFQNLVWTPDDATPLPECAPDAVTYFLQRAENDTSDVKSAAYAAYLINNRSVFGRHDKTDLRLMLQVCDKLSSDGFARLLLARTAAVDDGEPGDRDENAHRVFLEEAAQLGPDEVAARIELARYYALRIGNFRKSRALLDEALLSNPLALEAHLLTIDIDSKRGWDAVAQYALDTLLKRYPNDPRLLARAAKAAMERNDSAEAMRLVSHALDADSLSVMLLNIYIAAMTDLGRDGVLANRLTDFWKLSPLNGGILQALAEAHRRTGNIDAALEMTDDMLALCAKNAEALELRGHFLAAKGRDAEAMKAWEAALLLEPSRAGLQDYLRFRNGQEDEMGTVIPDLRAFVAQEATLPNSPWQPGDDRMVLLNEIGSRVHADGTRSRYLHYIVKPLTVAAARELERDLVTYDEENERFVLLTARVLRADGRLDKGMVTDHPRGKGERVRLFRFSPVSVGDVIEAAYRVDEHKQSFFGDYFGEIIYFQRFYPSRWTRYILETPQKRTFQVQMENGAPAPKDEPSRRSGLRRQVWEMHNLAALHAEPFMPPLTEFSPIVSVSSFASWDELARWYHHLIREQALLTPTMERTVRQITMGSSTPLEKLQAIFTWVSDEIRNEAWEFGIHGYKPYNTDTIFRRRFGDCKDKMLLINVMARAVGIEANPAILYALNDSGPMQGRGRETLALPVLSHFNHAISYTSLGNRDYWMDATAAYLALGEFPSMDAGASAMIILPDGAERKQIPSLDETSHVWNSRMLLKLDEDGSAIGQEAVEGKGVTAMYMRAWFGAQNRREGVAQMVMTRAWGATQITHPVQYLSDTTPGASGAQVKTAFRMEQFARKDGEALTFSFPRSWLRTPGFNTQGLPVDLRSYAKNSHRIHDVLLPLALTISADATVFLPKGWTPQALPEAIHVSYPFGDLDVMWEYDPARSAVQCRRTVHLRTTRIPKEQYHDFRRLCHLSDQVEQAKMVLLPSEQSKGDE